MRTLRCGAAAVLAATALTALAGCVHSTPAATAGMPTASRSSSALSTRASCDTVTGDPFGCGHYVTVGGTEPGRDSSWLRTAALPADFEHVNGTITLVLSGPVNTSNVPIRVSRAGGASNGAAVTSAGCVSPTSACVHDAWLGTLMSGPLTYAVDGRSVTITGATGTVVLEAAT